MRNKSARNVGVVVLLLLALMLSYWYWNRKTDSSGAGENVIADTGPGAGRKPAKVRGAVLYDNYEHYRENVPPRTDTKARANAWQPPPMPLQVIRAAIEAQSPGERENDLLSWMEAWDKGYREGISARGNSYEQLPLMLSRTKLGFEPLFEVGVALGFLEGEVVGANFHRAALRRAEEDAEYKDLSPVHPKAALLRRALPQMGYFWRLADYKAVEQRFRLEMQVYPPLSQEGRKCGHSCAEAMYYQGNSKEAAELIAVVLERHEQAADLNTSDKQEMGWIQGIFFYSDKRYAQAADGLAIAVSSGGSRASQAQQMLGMCLAFLPQEERDEKLKKMEGKLNLEQIKAVIQQVERNSSRVRPQ
jgi:hypothetical protein